MRNRQKIYKNSELYYTSDFQKTFERKLKDRGISVIGTHKNFLNKDVVTMVRPYYPDVAGGIIISIIGFVAGVFVKRNKWVK